MPEPYTLYMVSNKIDLAKELSSISEQANNSEDIGSLDRALSSMFGMTTNKILELEHRIESLEENKK
jgi:hypothetical protein